MSTVSGQSIIERASSADLMAFAVDRTDAPTSVAAILLLDSGSALDPAAVRGTIADRIRAVPRLRQRLVRAPFGCGRPYWIDDPHFDVDDHFRTVRCPEPADESALLGVAADTVTRRLAPHKPLWSATLVTGLADSRAAMILLLHHVLADGIGGLDVLAHLARGLEVDDDQRISRRHCDLRIPSPIELFSSRSVWMPAVHDATMTLVTGAADPHLN